jgi:putative two-component system response regulator
LDFEPGSDVLYFGGNLTNSPPDGLSASIRESVQELVNQIEEKENGEAKPKQSPVKGVKSRVSAGYTVLFVSASPDFSQQVDKFLSPFGYKVIAVPTAAQALEQLLGRLPDLVLTAADVCDMSGYDLCRRIKGNRTMEHIPVLLISEDPSIDDKTRALYVGADGFLSWPIHEFELRARVRSMVRIKMYHQRLRNEIRALEFKLKQRARELEEINLGLVVALEKANELNDQDTGMHIRRVCHFSRMLAEEHGLGPGQVQKIFRYASLHDVGKVAIPDAILKKPGKLTAIETEEMRKHAVHGYNLLLDAHADPVACNIALRHHEKWDGSGYPDGLSGSDIPVEARIVALADVYDAVTSRRCYKDAWTVEDARNFLMKESGKHFDPRLVEIFLHHQEKVREIQETFQDTKEAGL